MSVCFTRNKISDNFTEELLALHEHQVEVMKNYYDGNKEIFKLVERRETLFKTMEEFEVLVFICMLLWLTVIKKELTVTIILLNLLF